MRTATLKRKYSPSLVLFIVLGIVLGGCGTDSLSATPTAEPEASGQSTEARTLVLGNIDAKNPADKIAEFQPLLDYLVEHLEEYGIEDGEVLIAQDTAEMARLLESGEVDLYIDAAIPSLEVCATAGCDFALRQWKGGDAELAGIFVTSKTSGITSLEDLQGRVIMLEQPHSSVGHILPLAALFEKGITTRKVDNAEATVEADEVGYVVAPGGQSSMSLLLSGEIDALAIGERAFDRFYPDVQEQAVIIERTISAPSQLVAFSPVLDAGVGAEIRRLLISLEETDDGKATLKALRDTTRFDELPEGLDAELAELWETVQTVLQD